MEHRRRPVRAQGKAVLCKVSFFLAGEIEYETFVLVLLQPSTGRHEGGRNKVGVVTQGSRSTSWVSGRVTRVWDESLEAGTDSRPTPSPLWSGQDHTEGTEISFRRFAPVGTPGTTRDVSRWTAAGEDPRHPRSFRVFGDWRESHRPELTHTGFRTV